MVHGLSSCGTRALEHKSSVVGTCWLTCSAACGILVPQPGIESESLAGSRQNLFFFVNLITAFVCLVLAVLGLGCCVGFPLVAVCRLLVVVASLVAEHSL